MGTKTFSKPRDSIAGRSVVGSKGESVFRTDVCFCPHCGREMARVGPLTVFQGLRADVCSTAQGAQWSPV